MSDVFLSYARADLEFARRFASAIESMGWSVWWDRRIPTGSDFGTEIERELKDARCVIVLWSAQSVTSAYVRDEAGAALERGVLIPVRIEAVQPPLGFRQTQQADLLDWQGDAQSDGFARIAEAIERLSNVPASREPDFDVTITPWWAGWRSVAAVVAAIGLVAFVVYFVASVSDDSTMVLLEGGAFTMGSSEVEAKTALGSDRPARWAEREQPQHRVTLDSFYMDRYEVTVAQYLNFHEAQRPEDRTKAPLDAGTADYPVTGITWTDASRYCVWVGKQLPSEAQWEYAARGTERREFAWGNGSADATRAKFCDRNCAQPSSINSQGLSGTAPVGSHESGKTPQGIHDLAGNAAEWVRDAYDPRWYERSGPDNPLNDQAHPEGYRVVRGGSFADDDYFLRAATRNYRAQRANDPRIGFRCVRSRNDTEQR